MAPARPLQAHDAGPDGAGPLVLIRPLLHLPRAQVLDYLEDSGVSPLTDPTNTDPRFLRARLRAEVLPLLRRERPDLDRHVSDLCDQLRADAALLDDLADQALSRLTAGRPPGSLPAADLLALPLPLSSRVVLRAFGPLPHRLVLAVLDLCRSTQGSAALDLPDRRRAERRYGDLLVSTQAGPAPPEPVLIPGPGTYHLGQTTVRLQLTQHPLPAATPDPAQGADPEPGAAITILLDPQAIAFPLVLRPPRPGDRIRLKSLGRRKISDVLIDAKIPRAARPHVALLTHGDEILWVVGVRGADTAAPAGPQVLIAERLSPGLTGRGRMQ
jgi:tRNA(Ile)-lysidine synthetase-like protein